MCRLPLRPAETTQKVTEAPGDLPEVEAPLFSLCLFKTLPPADEARSALIGRAGFRKGACQTSCRSAYTLCYHHYNPTTATSLTITVSPPTAPPLPRLLYPRIPPPSSITPSESSGSPVDGGVCISRCTFLVAPGKLGESGGLSVCLSESPVNPHYPLQHCTGGLAEYKWPPLAPPVLHTATPSPSAMRVADARERVKYDLEAWQVFTACQAVSCYSLCSP
ncbi:unnamed protein product [Pleuronectes platessa]|uniref:Uncharacterized protein n=1 Tax=Pleuronectes platessa TaxID=8262 RepID=A0A9N7UPW0_PLEPL|nr:unnamed protein product [Pleuronectes platessa]